MSKDILWNFPEVKSRSFQKTVSARLLCRSRETCSRKLKKCFGYIQKSYGYAEEPFDGFHQKVLQHFQHSSSPLYLRIYSQLCQSQPSRDIPTIDNPNSRPLKEALGNFQKWYLKSFRTGFCIFLETKFFHTEEAARGIQRRPLETSKSKFLGPTHNTAGDYLKGL